MNHSVAPQSPALSPFKVLILPGWAGGTPDVAGAATLSDTPHPGPGWMTCWHDLYGDEIVVQDDFVAARKDEWIRRLEEVVSRQTVPVILVAHSLGCLLTASWAKRSPNVHRIVGALLVAPGDPERPGGVRDKLHTWIPIDTHTFPFTSILVASRNDHSCSLGRAETFAKSWGSTLFDNGDCGHMVGPNDPGTWPKGRGLLNQLARGAAHTALKF